MIKKLFMYLCFGISIVLASILLININEGKNIEEQYESKKIELMVKKSDAVFYYIENTIYKDALLEAKNKAKHIEEDVVKAYNGDMDKLKADLDGLLNGSLENYLVLDAIEKNIKGITFNNIEGDSADNNDYIIFLRNIIIGDLSANCATEKKTRDAQTESKQQFASNLSILAWEDITKSKGKTFWHFLPLIGTEPWYDDVKGLNSTDIEHLKDLYVKYGTNDNFLYKFEFISNYPLNDLTDILGNRVKSTSNVLNKNSYQMQVSLGFNLKDQLIHYPNLSIIMDDYNNKISNLNQERLSLKASMVKNNFFITFMFFLLFVLNWSIIRSIHSHKHGES